MDPHAAPPRSGVRRRRRSADRNQGPVALRPGALSLFRAGSISAASAAQVAGLPLPRFFEIFSSQMIPVVEGDAADHQDDLANARRWLNANP